MDIIKYLILLNFIRFRRNQRTDLRSPLIICWRACPGKRHSKNIQPMTGVPVITIAAANGVS
jgi:hypothetical protein